MGGPLTSLSTMQYSQFFFEVLVRLVGPLHTAAEQLHQRTRNVPRSTHSGKRQHMARPLGRIYSTNCSSASFSGFLECKFTSRRDFHFLSSIKRLARGVFCHTLLASCGSTHSSAPTAGAPQALSPRVQASMIMSTLGT